MIQNDIIQNILLMTVVGGIIGYSTNVIAVKMLFRPLKPFRVPIIGWEIQGLIPKRQDEIAKSIGKTVQDELISIEEIVDKLIEDTDKTALIESAKERILQMAGENMPPMVPAMFKGAILSYVADAVDKNADQFMTEISEKVVRMATEKVNIEEMVEEKIKQFDIMRLEEIIFSISKQELRHIEVLGGVLGVIIGLIQGLIISFI